MLSFGGIDKIRNHLIANPILTLPSAADVAVISYRYLLYVTCKTFSGLVNDPRIQRHERVCRLCARQLTRILPD